MPEFRGWIPTITGRLSFSTIGLGRNPRKLFKRFRAADGTRYTVVSQKRRTTDALFGKLGDLINWMRGREGYSVFVLFGKSFRADEFDEVSGPCVEFSVAEYSRISSRLEELRHGISDKDFEVRFNDLTKQFVDRAGDRPGTVTAFSIRRNGAFKADVPGEDELTERDHRDIASQVYFFVRDICHTHQHHAPTSDTILDVTSVDPVEDAWKRETAYALYRWVIQQKRARSVQAYLGAKGVLAYARAFEQKFSIGDADPKGVVP